MHDVNIFLWVLVPIVAVSNRAEKKATPSSRSWWINILLFHVSHPVKVYIFLELSHIFWFVWWPMSRSAWSSNFFCLGLGLIPSLITFLKLIKTSILFHSSFLSILTISLHQISSLNNSITSICYAVIWWILCKCAHILSCFWPRILIYILSILQSIKYWWMSILIINCLRCKLLFILHSSSLAQREIHWSMNNHSLCVKVLGSFHHFVFLNHLTIVVLLLLLLILFLKIYLCIFCLYGA